MKKLSKSEAIAESRRTDEENDFLRQRLGVSELDYKEAVQSLYQLAIDDTSGSKAAAQVLLSAYNSSNFQLAVADLQLMDLAYIEKALIVIRGCNLLFIGPHQVIDDGREKFYRLQELWPGYHKDNQHKR